MDSYIFFFDGHCIHKHFKEPLHFDLQNRSFKYGDGLFESFWVFKGRIFQGDLHINRLQEGMQKLFFEIPKNFDNLVNECLSHLNDNSKDTYFKCRLHVWRSGGGNYKPINNTINFYWEAKNTLDLPFKDLPAVKAGIFEQIRKPINLLSSIKSANSLLYVLASAWAAKQHLDTALLLNEAGNLIEGDSANILFFDGNFWYCPLEASGYLPGITLKIITQDLANSNKIRYKALEVSDLVYFKEIALLNAIQGVVPISTLGKQRFYTTASKQLQQRLRQLFEIYYTDSF